MNEFLRQLSSSKQRDVQVRVHKLAVSVLISYADVHGVLWHVLYICYYTHNYLHIWRVGFDMINSKCSVTYLFVTVRIQFHHSRYSHLCTYNNASKSIWIAYVVLMMLLVSTTSIFLHCTYVYLPGVGVCVASLLVVIFHTTHTITTLLYVWMHWFDSALMYASAADPPNCAKNP